MTRFGKLSWVWVSVLVIIIDQSTKYWTLNYLPLQQMVEVIPNYLAWFHTYNFGAAWSFLADHSGWQKWLFAGIAFIISIVLVIWLTRLKSNKETWLAIALALVLGGALGNLYDRVVLGYVVDFILAHWHADYYFPAFNIADTAITVGAAMLIIDMLFFAKKRESKSE
ncbi:signal peptidase II [Entomomonas sp. E2T0]|uniref:signal peptidase II n=1 Tax=Entomomonas sp. E2T0 TaxID=2930213 RepID=UPI0022282E3E|nr:signal peptidase II [Entomomonas sp. E2T0]UYZ85150.1 signal peptidase II [Entomomonas sp. E2T0]